MLEKISFREIYDSLPNVITPKQEFLQRVARATGRKTSTVKMWLSGQYYPDKLAVEAIAKEFGVDPESLFPKLSKSKAKRCAMKNLK